jgi:hypothetical protein
MDLTPHSTLRQWLTVSLAEQNGAASKSQALAFIEQNFGDLLTEDDWLLQPSRKEIKWRNRTAFERTRMVRAGLLKDYSPYDTWQLSDLGWAEYRTLIGEIAGSAASMWDFKPKSSEEYRAQVIGRTIVKTRDHESLVNDFAAFATSQGFTVRSPHPRDLTLHRASKEWLVEAKIVRPNVPTACRDALGQLNDYRYFLHAKDADVRLLALFDTDIGDAYLQFMNTMGIAVIWRSGDGWSGCPIASTSGLL